MSIILTDSKYYQGIADAINEKTGEFNKYTPAEMAFAIRERLAFIPPTIPWEWGDETAVGDAEWWNGLTSWITSANPEKRQAMLGKTKRVSLSSPVLGSNQVLMRCVGYDLDGSETLTFAAVSALAQKTAFGPNGKWIGSTARKICHDFYNACSAKNSILTVSKGTCPSTNSSRYGTPTYNDETVFLMSEREFGLNQFSSITPAIANSTRSECTYGKNTRYQYFTDNNKRIFKLGNANGDATSDSSFVWERSISYNSASYACGVRSDGTADYDPCGSSRGVLPAFAVGQA